jgi:SAM-dependent methyltransferase/acyl carrier protein
VVLDDLATRLAQAQIENVALVRAEAADFSAVEPGVYDTAVLNSVVQYFPNLDHLAAVLRSLAERLAPNGRIFLGDLRALPLLKAFHTSVALADAAPGTLVNSLAESVRLRLAEEQELVIDPSYFATLLGQHRVSGVSVRLKRGAMDSELTRFRYDVVLDLDAHAPLPDVRWHDWEVRGLALERLREVLADEPVTGVRGVPNARVLADVAAAERLTGAATVEQLRAGLPHGGVHPETLIAAAERLGYQARCAWSPDRPDRFDAVFAKGVLPASILPIERASFGSGVRATDPGHAGRQVQLSVALRRHLESLLPSFMLPAAIVPLDVFPLTPHGKVDRAALPIPEARDHTGVSEWVPPRDETEEALAAIWRELMTLDRVGVTDNFFALGGHSLLATQIVSRIRTRFGVEMPLITLFERPTIAELAPVVRSLASHPGAAPPSSDAPPAGELDHLSDEAVDSMLRSMLMSSSG